MKVNQNVNLTKIFIRFLKNEGLYERFKEKANDTFYFYDGLIDNLFFNSYFKKIDEVVNGNKLSIIFLLLFNDRIDEFCLFRKKWENYVHSNKYNNDVVKPYNNYFNIATPLIRKFLIENNALREVTNVLYVQGKIPQNEIQDNDLDKLLRRYQVSIRDFFANENTFCNWAKYKSFEPQHITWKKLSDETTNHTNSINKKNIGVLVP